MTGSEIKEQVYDAVACDDMFYRHELRDAIFDMVDENAKLREFAKSYLAAVGVDCYICPYRDPDLCDTETDPMSERCRLWKEMRELGVEVNDDTE